MGDLVHLQAPDGFEWVEWEPALECPRCRGRVSITGPSVEEEQQAYDAWALAHRGTCRPEAAGRTT